MKINIEAQLLCLESKYLRGIPFYIINLLKALDKRNKNEYSVSFFDFYGERNNRRYIDKYVLAQLKNTKCYECNSLSYKTILDAIYQDNHGTYNQKAYSEYIGAKADIFHFPSVANVPQNVDGKIVVTVCDILPLLNQFKHYWTEDHQRNFLNSINYIKENRDIEIISISENTKNDLVEVIGIEPERIHAIPLAYDSVSLYSDKDHSVLKKLRIESEYLLYLGAIDYRKGIVEIIESFDLVKEKYPDIKLVLAGNVEKIFETELKASLNKCRNKNNIIFTGFVDENEKRVLMSCAYAFLFPSEYEGFGLPILEGMACGTPIITTNVSSIPEVGENAVLYVEKSNYRDLTEKILYLLENENVRRKYIDLGYKQIRKFSWEKTAQMTETVYEKVGK